MTDAQPPDEEHETVVAAADARPSLSGRLLALPAWARVLVGVVGVVLALALLAVGLGSFDTGSAPVSVPGSVIHRPATTR